MYYSYCAFPLWYLGIEHFLSFYCDLILCTISYRSHLFISILIYTIFNNHIHWAVQLKIAIVTSLGSTLSCLLIVYNHTGTHTLTVLNNSKHFQPEGGRHSYPKSTVGGLLAGSSRNQVTKRRQPFLTNCVYCGQPHWSDDCSRFATLQARKENLRGSCYKCLKKGHLLKDCQRDRLCAHCGTSGHHRSLCLKLFPSPDQNSNKAPQNTQNLRISVT